MIDFIVTVLLCPNGPDEKCEPLGWKYAQHETLKDCLTSEAEAFAEALYENTVVENGMTQEQFLTILRPHAIACQKEPQGPSI